MSAVSPRRVHLTAVRGRFGRRVMAQAGALPRALVVLLLVAFVHGSAWAVVTAPWNGPDEVAHFAYAEHLARTGHAPEHDRGNGGQSAAHNVALFQLNLFPIRLQPGGRPTYSALGRTKADLAALPASAYENGSGPNSAANYPPLYYVYEAVAYDVSPFRSELGRLFTMRIASVLLLVIVVGLAWAIAAELLATGWAVAVATTMVALQPKLGFGGGIVNPDVMLVMWASGVLLAALRLVRYGPTTARVVTLTAGTMAAVLTHPRGYFLAPFALIVLALSAWRSSRGPRWSVIAAAAMAAGIALSVGAAVLWARAHAAAAGAGGGGGSGTINPTSGFNPRQFLSYVWQFYLPKLSFMAPKVGPPVFGYRQMFIESFFGSFASFSVEFRALYYDLMQLLAGLGIAALYATIVARWNAVVRNWRIVLLCVVFFAGLMALLHLVSYSTLRTSTDPVITGRYLLPAVPLYGAAVGWVCSSLPRRVGLPVAGILLGIATLAALAGVGLSAERFYV